jgi:hypothetical protein
MPFGAGRYGVAAEHSGGAVRANAIAVGLLYIAIGVISARHRKAHFEPVWVGVGMILLFGAVLSGTFGGSAWIVWEAVLAVLGAAALALCWRLRRPLEFAIATAAMYIGGFRILGEVMRGQGGLLIVAAWSAAALVFLIRATRRLRRTD